ncbi:hypothetical protein CEXT_251631 [Caerostris extrusa]|uniref:Uncharacterized protein n=1 Tax=Caerostris extrusa TaxID=172846 RepID=A0AAV4WJB0_CAEEX|nr:hypothetical protein CEXT_251631 [Caerostris extrusa]
MGCPGFPRTSDRSCSSVHPQTSSLEVNRFSDKRSEKLTKCIILNENVSVSTWCFGIPEFDGIDRKQNQIRNFSRLRIDGAIRGQFGR